MKAAQISNEVHDLRVAEPGEWRHLRPAHAGSDRPEQIAVSAAMRERAGVQRRAAIAATLAGRPMAGLTELREKGLTLSRGRRGLPEGGDAPAERGRSQQDCKKSVSHLRRQ